MGKAAFTQFHTQGLKECSVGGMTEERKNLQKPLAEDAREKLMAQKWQVEKGTKRQNKCQCKVPHCLLSSSVPQPARKNNTGLLPMLHAKQRGIKANLS